MYYDDGQYCERCHMLYYLKDIVDFSGHPGLCPKCNEYFKKHPDKYLLFTGEYIKCKYCGKEDHYMFYNSDGFCNNCEEKFRKYPIVRWTYNLKQKLLWLGSRFLFYLLIIAIGAIVLAIAYYYICALIGDFVSIDDSFLEGTRMKP